MIIRRLSRTVGVAAFIALIGSVGLGSARAAKNDRSQPMVVEADRPGTVDLQHQLVTFNGNVVISQGTMVLRADRVEMHEMADGYRAATALGTPGKPATWRQRRDGVDEVVEGSANKIEFDGRADTLRFIGQGTVQRLRDGRVSDEITGSTIIWDNNTEVFKVEGGTATAANPSGRVRAVLSPRAEPASGAASAAPSRTVISPPLTPSRGLGDKP
ncbi:MAG: lipopolysaccharide transport periplasmic protein LptA [Pseudomonadota bacterium]|nr:lipopolysaccharide transport periplasmic protein LptA [Pseudomonadota bacterium]